MPTRADVHPLDQWHEVQRVGGKSRRPAVAAIGLRPRRAGLGPVPGAGVAAAARACRRARGADRGTAEDQRRPPGPDGRRTTMIAMAVTAKKLDVKIGDLVEIAGRKY